MDLTGQTLGQYRIIEKIGRGGMAEVYKAFQPRLERYVAIKVLPPYFAHEETFLERFEREARAVASLRHPNILTIYDYGEQEGLTYLVMEYVEGGTLKQRLGQPLDMRWTAEVIGHVGDALAYAHGRGVIHRDVKPANILMQEEDWPLLSDFGLAKMIEQSVQLTKTGVGVGTPEYMSPEQARGEEVDERSDVYSLGIMLFEMLTGRAPYEADTPLAVVLKHLTAALPLPREINPAIPEPVERVILKALAKGPSDRFQSVGQMVEALEKALEAAKAEERRPQQEKLAALYAEAVGFLKAKEWRKALDKWAEVQAIDPRYPDPQEVAATAGREIERLAEEKRRQERLAALYTEAVGFLKAKEWQKALDKWAEVQAIHPDYPDLQEVAATAKREIERLEKAKRRREKRAALYAKVGGFLKAAAWRKVLDKWAEIPVWQRMPGWAWALGVLGVLLAIIGITFFIWTWTRGGTSLLFASDLFTSNRDGKREVYRLAGEEGVLRVTSTPGRGESWSPALELGGAVLFTSDRDGKREIYRLTGAREVVRLTHTPDDGESWAPVSESGGTILFTSDRDGKREIYRLTGAREVVRLTHTPDDGESWSPVSEPDGTILFTSDRDGKREVYRLTGEGQVVRVTHTPGDGESWSPAR